MGLPQCFFNLPVTDKGIKELEHVYLTVKKPAKFQLKSIPPSAKGKDYEIYLDIKPASSFIYRGKNLEVSSEAKGKWESSLTDTISLVRDSVALPEMLASGYRKNMPDKVIVENKNEVKVGAVMLRRKS